MKFGQLIENNMRNIYLKKSYTKFGKKTIYFVLIVCQVEDYRK